MNIDNKKMKIFISSAIIVLLIISISSFIVIKNNIEENRIKKSNEIFNQLQMLIKNQDNSLDSTKENYASLLSKYQSARELYLLLADKYENTNAFDKAHELMYKEAESIYLKFSKAISLKIPDMQLALYYYNILEKYFPGMNAYSGTGGAKDTLEKYARIQYDKLYKLVINSNIITKEQNDIYSNLVTYFSNTDSKKKADELMSDPEKYRKMVRDKKLAEEAAERNSIAKERLKRERNEIHIGDPESDIYYLQGNYERTTSETSFSKTNHYFGGEGARYKYIIAENGIVTYISY